MSKEKSKEVAVVKNEYAVSNAGMFDGMGLGAGEEIDTMDILIPKLMLTQGLTKAVAAGRVPVGKYMNSVDETVVGDSIEIIVISSYKTWQVFEVVEGKKDEYIETLDYYTNEKLEYNEVVEGKQIKRKQVLGFHCLLISEIKAGCAFPYIVDFKGASKQAGRALTSHFAKLRSVGLPSFAKVFTIGTQLVQDDNTYYVKTVDMGRDITAEELTSIKLWAAELQKSKDKIKVDDSDLQEAPSKANNNVVDVDSDDLPF